MNYNTQNEFLNNCNHWGEVMVKGARGARVKIIFQGLHMTHVIFALVYNLKFCILDASFNILDISTF
jgi:hypothetical protein